MTRDIRFYCRAGRWYADLPEVIAAGGTEENNEMVQGADTWLEFLAKGEDHITLTISDDEKFPSKLICLDQDEFGADYIEDEYHHEMWLCAVTKFLFNCFPQTIYYKIKL